MARRPVRRRKPKSRKSTTRRSRAARRRVALKKARALLRKYKLTRQQVKRIKRLALRLPKRQGQQLRAMLVRAIRAQRRIAKRGKKKRTVGKRKLSAKQRRAIRRFKGSALWRYNLKRKSSKIPRDEIMRARIARKVERKRAARAAELAKLSPEERHRQEHLAELRKRLAERKKAQLSLF